MKHPHALVRDNATSARDATLRVSPCLPTMRLALTAFLAAAAPLLPTAATAQQADGERLFRQRCGTCHSLDAGQNRAGPHLSGIVGRPAGSVEGARYSEAMRNSGIVWDSQSLDTFLAAPRQMVPGTSMTVGAPNAAQRAAIIAYLEGGGAQ